MRTTHHTHLHRRKAHLGLLVVLSTFVGLSLAASSGALTGPAGPLASPAKSSIAQDKFKPIVAAPKDQIAASIEQAAAVAEKKQGDQQLSDLFNTDEYVQIKPEEINVNEQGKEVEPTLSLLEPQSPAAAAAATTSTSSAGGAQPVAEHKSAADDELNAHLAQDTISSLESSHRPYAAGPRVRPAPAGYQGRPSGGPHRPPPPPPPPGYGRGPPRGYQPTIRGPVSSYMALKGKLAGGISSLVGSQGYQPSAPHPPPPPAHHMRLPRVPHGHPPPPPPPPMAYGPRYLPRGAAAGYAAFREFVRAQASKYKQTSGLSGPHEPAAYNAAPNHHGGRYVEPMPAPKPEEPAYGPPPAAPVAPPAPEQYRAPAAAAAAPEAYAPAPAPAPAGGDGYGAQAPAAAPKTKVSVAQAYIPHLTPGSSSSGEGKSYQQGPSSSGYQDPMLAKLYGGHAPQGVGKPEYSKDYGMVIHYPQATVYTEPMTVDQLHKLTGSGITQILEQLQYNIANGHRDESNTIRAHQKHNLGHGLTIHAKEYYAPGKTGHYVPTTAAVISSSSKNYDAPTGEGYQNQNGGAHGPPASYESGPSGEAYGMKAELGSGYERVKAAVAASAGKYNNGSGHQKAANSKPAYGAEQVGNLLSSSELDSLYKANAALTKHLDQPEIHAQIQSYAEQIHAKGPLKVTEHDQRSPLSLHAGPPAAASGPRPYGPPAGRPHHPPMHHYRQPHPQRPRGPRRPNGHPQRGPYGPRPGHHARPHQQQAHRYRNNNNNNHHHHQNQQQQYNMAEQAVHQQMMQLLHDFQVGDEQYNSKGQPAQASNQGYPHKVLQKHQQQQQQYQQQQQQQYQQNQQGGYNLDHSDNLEIPQGPNDQIGEISELIDALKGTLESGKAPEETSPGGYAAAVQPEVKQVSKLEDVRYLSATLGQVPSYAMQVAPIGSSTGAEHEAKKGYGEAAPAGPAPAAGYQQPPTVPATHHVQQQQQPVASYQPPASAVGYPQQSAGEQTYANNANGYQQQQVHENAGGYSQQQQQQQSASYGQQHQQVDGYQQQADQSGYQQQAPVHQQAAQAADYVQQVAQAAAAATASGGSPYGAVQPQQVAGADYQQHQAPAQAEPLQPYTHSEHTQVINHLVPVQQHQQQPQQQTSSGYAEPGQQQAAGVLTTQVASSGHHQPINQIGVAAPTEQHYQQAQSLSSFVDSLPSDYQELLRQPSGHLLEGAASAQETSYTNATSAGALHGDILKSSVSSSSSSSSSAGQSSSSPASSGSSSSTGGHHHDLQSAASSGQTYQQSHKSSSSSSSVATSSSSSSSSSPAATSSAGSQPSSSSKRKA